MTQSGLLLLAYDVPHVCQRLQTDGGIFAVDFLFLLSMLH